MERKSSIFIRKLILFVILSLVIIGVIFSIPEYVFETNEVYMTKSQFESVVEGGAVSVSKIRENESDKIREYAISYKLFDLFTIKKLRVKVIDNAQVYAGGVALGFDIYTKGLTVIGSNVVLTNTGFVEPMRTSDLRAGDLITKLDEIEIIDSTSLSDALELCHDDKMKVTYLRGDQERVTYITPAYDIQQGKLRLGLWVKNNITGLGTLTFVSDKKDKYASLGHAITNPGSTTPIDATGGDLYPCEILGVKRGQVGSAGELKGTFTQGVDIQGDIVYIGNTGLYGNLYSDATILDNKSPISVGTRIDAHSGPAKILCDIDGRGSQAYDIDIVKTNFQTHSSEKSMIIKVTDPRLLETTGGIVQGMSGSPIIQDGKIIGAVTHVFVSDPTKGYGIYIDWMLETMQAVL